MLSQNSESGSIAKYPMSGNMASLSIYKSDPIRRKTLRYAIGMVIMFAIVFLINWPMSFLFIVFGSIFLLGGKPSWKFAFNFASKFAVSSLAAIVLCYLFIDFYLLYLLVIGLILLNIFYADDATLDHVLKLAMIITFGVIPLMWLKSPMIGFIVASSLTLGIAGALLFAIIMFELIPDIEVGDTQDKAHAHPIQSLSKQERYHLALKSLAVFFPMIILFNFFNLHGHILIIVWVGILAGQTSFANDLSASKIMVKTTFFGGLVAAFMYEILVIVPNFTFFMLMIFGLALYGGHQIITGGKYALNIQKGLSAIIIIFVGVADTIEGDAEAKMWLRVVQMTTVVVYVILNFKLFEMLFPQTDKKS